MYPGISEVLLYNNSAISPEEVRDEVDFLHADKHQIFLQVRNEVHFWHANKHRDFP